MTDLEKFKDLFNSIELDYDIEGTHFGIKRLFVRDTAKKADFIGLNQIWFEFDKDEKFLMLYVEE